MAKIGSSNTSSIALFEKLGFVKTKVVEVFSEVEMRWKGGNSTREAPFSGGREIDWL
jgi:RimJ/RimL family protein N-acetyltransferase